VAFARTHANARHELPLAQSGSLLAFNHRHPLLSARRPRPFQISARFSRSLMFRLLLPTARSFSVPAARFSSSTGRWYAAKASSSSRKRPAASSPPPSTSSSAGDDGVETPSADPEPAATSAVTPKPRRVPAQSSAFFVQRARKLQADRDRAREAQLIVVPVATGKEVQYATREEYDAARQAEDELKKGRIRRAAELFDEGKLPEELRSLVGGCVRPEEHGHRCSPTDTDHLRLDCRLMQSQKALCPVHRPVRFNLSSRRATIEPRTDSLLPPDHAVATCSTTRSKTTPSGICSCSIGAASSTAVASTRTRPILRRPSGGSASSAARRQSTGHR
jgi:hypothetical protein